MIPYTRHQLEQTYKALYISCYPDEIITGDVAK
jgi:hypothetical protein